VRALAATAIVVLLAACGGGGMFESAPTGPCIGNPHDVPHKGWLSDDGAIPAPVGDQVTKSAALDDLTRALPDGFHVTHADEWDAPDDCVTLRTVTAENDDGGTIFVELRQLDGTGTLFNVPLSGQQSNEQYGSRGALVTDDFNGDGNRVTALVITDGGAWTRVTATGANGQDLSGWPTTMPPTTAAGDPQPSPLALDEVVDLAKTISASTSTRSST
jgi:hypothetical protein